MGRHGGHCLPAATACLIVALGSVALLPPLSHAVGGVVAPRVGRVCEALIAEVGGYLPRALRCPCSNTTLATATAAFQVNEGLHILADLNEEACASE